MMFGDIIRKYVLVNLIVLSVCETGFEWIARTDFDQEILKSIPCIQEICKKYFNTGQPMGGSIILVSLHPDDPMVQHKLLEILNRDFNFDWTLMIKDQNPETDYESVEKAKNYFTIINRSEDVLEIINKWKALSTWNPMAQVVILMARDMEPIELESTRRHLMTLLLQNHVLNAYVVSLLRNASRVEVATLFPYDDDNCADRVLRIAIMDNCEYDPEIDLSVDSDNIVLWEVNNHYENKLPNDLHQCPLMASARLWEPYAVAESNGNGFSVGIDVNILKTIAEKLNLDLFITQQNGSIYQVYDEIAGGIYDLMIGGIDEDPAYHDYISSTIPYYQDDLTWCVAKAAPSVAWMKIWGMFDGITWLSVLMFLIVSAIFIFAFQYLIEKKQRIVRSVLTSISIILNQPLLVPKYTLSFRFVMIGFIIFGMILNVMYQSMLITTLTKPSLQPQIKEVQQIMNMKMKVFGGFEVSRHLEKNDSIQTYLRGNLEMCSSLDDCLKTLSVDQKRAVAASREHVIYNPRIQRENIYCFSILENIYSYLVTVVTIKNFHLLDKFNRIIRQISEAGLITKWKSELDHAITLKEELKKVRDSGPKPLTFDALYGIFIMGSIMLFLSFLVFMFELFIFKMARQRRASKFWIFIDKKLLTNREKLNVD